MTTSGRTHWRALLTPLLVALAWPGALPGTAVGQSGCSGVLVAVAPPTGAPATECVTNDGDLTAAELFTAAGHRLTRVQRFPGAVCRVDGVPAEDPCVAMPPADAYWGLFSTDDGQWRFATLGVDALRPSPGGAVALAWQDGAEVTAPPVDPGTDTRSGTSAVAPATEVEGWALPTWVLLTVGAGIALVLVTVRRRGSP